LPGALQRRRFSGPWNFNLDLAVQKITRIAERHSLEFRMESFNLTNRPTFYVGDEAAAPAGSTSTAPPSARSSAHSLMPAGFSSACIIASDLYSWAEMRRSARRLAQRHNPLQRVRTGPVGATVT